MILRNLLLFPHIDCVCCFRWNSCGDINCKKLGALDISRNSLTGSIPTQLAYIEDLYLLNVSHNELSGPIPAQLQSVQTLNIIDFSYNNLSGAIPQFDSYNVSAFEGNPLLCGGLLRACNNSPAPSPGPGSHRSGGDPNLLAWLVGALFTAALIVLLVGVCCFFRKYRWHICKYLRRESTTRPWKLTAFQRLDFSASQVRMHV